MNLVYRPLPAVWPSGPRTPSYERRWPRFKATMPATLKLLERELLHLGVSLSDTIVIEAGYRESDIRLDGKPRANASPNDPAIVVSFKSRYGPLRYGCDTFTTDEANLRAIALTLERLRACERYGVTKRGEQYQGWKQLAAPGESMSQIEARTLLGRLSGNGSSLEITDEQLYRKAVKHAHPDVGGTREDWEQVQRAKEVLGI